MRSFLVGLASVAALLASVGGATAGSGGVGGPAFYVDGVLYRTVNTPTDLFAHGRARIELRHDLRLRGAQPFNVATAAPGDPGFNRGRWQVHGLRFVDYDAALEAFDTNGSGDFDSDEEIAAALKAGAATDVGVVTSFECPVIAVP